MNEVWMVRLSSGETRAMTLDELDAAYQSDRIDERTLVRAPHGPWTTLGELLGVGAPAPQPASMRPVSIDLEEDLAVAKLRSSSRRNMALIGGLALAAGAIFAVVKVATTAPAPTAAAAAQITAAPPPVVTAPAPQPEPAPVAKPQLTDAQKEALAKADQKREQKAKSAKERKVKTPSQPSKPVFTKGGDKYDPLNAKL